MLKVIILLLTRLMLLGIALGQKTSPVKILSEVSKLLREVSALLIYNSTPLEPADANEL